MEQILYVGLVFDLQRRSIFAAQSQLAGDEVESLAECLRDVQVIYLDRCRSTRGRSLRRGA